MNTLNILEAVLNAYGSEGISITKTGDKVSVTTNQTTYYGASIAECIELFSETMCLMHLMPDNKKSPSQINTI